MRISRQIRQILQVLDKSNGPMKMTQIILEVKNLKPYRTHLLQDPETKEILKVEKPWPPFIQLELASAIAGTSVSWWMGGDANKAHAEASKLYASFGRSIRRLLQESLISDHSARDRKRQHAFFLTDKGRELLSGLTNI